ncbi:MAG: hypothetical protein IT439_11785 [Phycisphaerales bacterium]|nr:hypothetical protein [Phycisphaerales bacterium]
MPSTRLSRFNLALMSIWAAVPILGGCIQLRVPDDRPRIKAVENSGPLKVIAGGTRITYRSLAAAQITNPMGGVVVEVDPTLARAVVEADASFPPGLPGAARDAYRKALSITAVGELTDSRVELMVNLAIAEGVQPVYPVLLVVRTPSCDQAIVRNVRGDVEMVGVSGAINIHSGVIGDEPGGNVRIRTDSPVRGPVKIATTGGEITLYLPPSSEGDFTMSTLDGRVSVIAGSARLTHAQHKPGEWTGVMNGGKNEFLIETMKGNISLRVDQENWATQAPFQW